VTDIDLKDSQAIMNRFSLAERRKTLRKFRERAGLTLEELAEKSGLSKSMISKFELGHRDLSPEAFARLRVAIHKTLDRQRAVARRTEQSKRKDAAQVEKLAGKITGLPLRSLLGGEVSKQYVDSDSYKQMCKTMEREYGTRWREVFKDFVELGRTIGTLENTIAKLERSNSLNDPIVQEVIASLRREISNLEQQRAAAPSNPALEEKPDE
jgi:transcriptional regulator with XRE-family HTH domain